MVAPRTAGGEAGSEALTEALLADVEPATEGRGVEAAEGPAEVAEPREAGAEEPVAEAA